MARTAEPHQVFRADFDAMLHEGARQERLHPANEGEANVVRVMHGYFDEIVMPLIRRNDWVYGGVCDFVTSYAQDCFDFLAMEGAQSWELQQKSLARKREVADFLAEAYGAGALHKHRLDDAGEMITKASDFLEYVKLYRVPSDMRARAVELHKRVCREEVLQLKWTLHILRAAYENPLPRVLYVVRRAVKVHQELPDNPSYDDRFVKSERCRQRYTSHPQVG